MARRDAFAFLEFFAGGGMARIGLGASWRCLFANDYDPMKRAAYGADFGLDHHHGADINTLSIDDLPAERADLAWASSPCQDLSLAGTRGGIDASRSGAFFGFWRLIEQLDDGGRAPRMIVVENVAGLLTSNGGEDFTRVISLMAARDYCVSAIVLNADAFVAQSRPRLFIVAVKSPDASVFSQIAPAPDLAAPKALFEIVDRLPREVRRRWRWLAARPQVGRNSKSRRPH